MRIKHHHDQVQYLSPLAEYIERRAFLYIILMLLLAHGCNNNQTGTQTEELPITESLLLKNYRPVSIYNIPETKISSAAYPAIDMHAHSYAKSRAEVDQWVQTMDNAGIERIAILSHAHGAEFDSLVAQYRHYMDRFDLWCGIDYTSYQEPDFASLAIAELHRCKSLGAAGVGELGDKGKGLFYSKPAAWDMHPDDPRMDPVWEACAKLKLPVNLHIADPKWMYETMDSTNDGMINAFKWRLDNQEGIKSHDEMIRILENTVSKHPGTTFIACHLANCTYDLNIIGALLDQYPNLYIDVSARFAELGAIPRRTRDFIVDYQDRILYGTDMGRAMNMYQWTFRMLETADEHIYNDYNSYHWPIHAFDLPNTVLEKIYRLNALKVLGTS